MPGPTAWQQQLTSQSVSTQSITTTTETVIATLSGVFSRSVGAPVNLTGSAVFAVNASTTSVTLRLRYASLTGTQLTAQTISGGIAGDITAADGTIGFTDNPTGEYANQVYVMTIQATAAAANWNVTFASLSALF